MKDLKGLTIAEGLKEIERTENKRFYQAYVITERTLTKDLKKVYKKVHLYNENKKRVYKIHTILKRVYAIDKSIENNNFIIDFKIEKGQHSLMSFEGIGESYNHNIYLLIVNDLAKGNKSKPQYQTIKTDLIEYKEGELTLKQRRICL